MPVIEFSMVQSIGFAVLLLVIGRWLRRNVYFFERFAIPSAVIGGFLFAIINLFLHIFEIVDIQFDTTLQTFFMIIFFTSIGFGASPRILKAAGPKVAKFLIVAAVLCVFQNLIPFLLADVLGVSKGIALMTGSTPMTGGHGTSGGIAPLVEAAGFKGAEAVAYTAATFGLVAGSLMGGPLANHLIQKKDLLHKRDKAEVGDELDESLLAQAQRMLSSDRILRAFLVMLIAMFLGSYVTDLLNLFVSNLTTMAQFPAYLGPMLFGILARAISDANLKKDGGKWTVPSEEIEIVGNVGLNLFLAMALMSVRLWELADLAVPMAVLLGAQLVLMFVYARFVTFKVMGSTYDAAVLTSGHCGFGMGATPNGVANMESIVDKYLPSKTAFFVLPIVGGMFIDFVNILVITGFMYFI
ncbi:MAG: sodium/glutamate symporter [Actinomycetaceae bacterium]|nr:sodium/glutamate symporter [Arcanobacterium sp.]MDD7505659.1 sodium/glutamate symporter [Actinomycetaceae bacterium]MDY6143444.1 sodium/glutamate symporter [Arcanobacterium sp.]